MRGRGGGMIRGGGNMNPGAQSFSPGGAGNKRPHEDSQNGVQQGNGQKRARGGGAGA